VNFQPANGGEYSGGADSRLRSWRWAGVRRDGRRPHGNATTSPVFGSWPPDARLHPAPAQRRQEHPRSDPLPQALPRPPRLATAPAAHPAQDIHTINFLT